MDWFGVDEITIKSILYENFKYIPILAGTQTSIGEPHPMSKRIEAFLNPFKDFLNINIEVKTDSLLKLVDSNGREINKIVDKKLKMAFIN